MGVTAMQADDLAELEYEYLRVARQLARTDPDSAVIRLGISRQAVTVLANKNREELAKMASSQVALLQLRGRARAEIEGQNRAPGKTRRLQTDLRELRD